MLTASFIQNIDIETLVILLKFSFFNQGEEDNDQSLIHFKIKDIHYQ